MDITNSERLEMIDLQAKIAFQEWKREVLLNKVKKGFETTTQKKELKQSSSSQPSEPKTSMPTPTPECTQAAAALPTINSTHTFTSNAIEISNMTTNTTNMPFNMPRIPPGSTIVFISPPEQHPLSGTSLPFPHMNNQQHSHLTAGTAYAMPPSSHHLLHQQHQLHLQYPPIHSTFGSNGLTGGNGMASCMGQSGTSSRFGFPRNNATGSSSMTMPPSGLGMMDPRRRGLHGSTAAPAPSFNPTNPSIAAQEAELYQRFVRERSRLYMSASASGTSISGSPTSTNPMPSMLPLPYPSTMRLPPSFFATSSYQQHLPSMHSTSNRYPSFLRHIDNQASMQESRIADQNVSRKRAVPAIVPKSTTTNDDDDNDIIEVQVVSSSSPPTQRNQQHQSSTEVENSNSKQNNDSGATSQDSTTARDSTKETLPPTKRRRLMLPLSSNKKDGVSPADTKTATAPSHPNKSAIGVPSKEDADDFMQKNGAGSCWDQRFQQLSDFKKQHGDCNISQSNDNRGLAGWVKTQRYQYKQYTMDQPTPMTPERIVQLENIDFDWNPRPAREEKLWMDRYEELQAYKKEHGHCMVPQKSETRRQLGLWVTNQRRQFRRMQEKRKSHMTELRVEMLNDIKFEWEPNHRKRVLIEESAPKQPEESEEE